MGFTGFSVASSQRHHLAEDATSWRGLYMTVAGGDGGGAWRRGRSRSVSRAGRLGAAADQDVVDRDVHELDEEADEAHHEEAHGRGAGDARELCSDVGGERERKAEGGDQVSPSCADKSQRGSHACWETHPCGPAWCTS